MSTDRWLLVAAVTLALNACTLTDSIETGQRRDSGQPVEFDTYLGHYATTRANQTTGALTLAGMENAGFGVFGYYHDGQGTTDGTYTAESTPNFMYQQQVTKDGKWTYSPTKYWPNETGGTAESEHTDRLSFLAYAPYTDVEELTDEQKAGPGIYDVSANTAAGDAVVYYRSASNPAEAVDLLWATDGTGQPLLNLSKQDVGETVNLVFHHALTRLNIEVAAAIDELTKGSPKPTGTKILVESIQLTPVSDDALGLPYMEGSFNLNTASDANGWTTTASRTYATADAAIITDLAPKLAYKAGALYADQPEGLTNTSGEPLFGSDKGLMFIPNTANDGKANYKVKMTYHVMTDNTAGADVTNEITSDEVTIQLVQGMATTLTAIIGLQGVTFNVTSVDVWGDTMPLTFSLLLSTSEVF